MKTLALFMIILGFSYCMTSFYNFYSYIFGINQIANGNIIIMSLGLLFPLYTFIFGVFFYFYTDKDFASINPFILSTGISLLIVGVSRIFINYGIMEFLHFTFSYVLIVLSLLLIYGCIRFKY
jgi:hypothetical protein